jgi:hypothetical protein
MSASEDLFKLRLGEARRSPQIEFAAGLVEAGLARRNERALDPALRVSRVLVWARRRIAKCVEEAFDFLFVLALLELLAAFGADLGLSARRRGKLRRLLAAEHLRHIAPPGGAS